MTRGRIERYHRSLKDILLLDNYYCPDDLIAEIGRFVEHYNHRWYQKSLDHMTPADVCHGRAAKILAQRERTRRWAIKRRRTEYQKAIAVRQ